MTPQPGNVKTQVRTISLATPQLTDLGSLAAPAPMIAAVLVWVVDMVKKRDGTDDEGLSLQSDDLDVPFYQHLVIQKLVK